MGILRPSACKIGLRAFRRAALGVALCMAFAAPAQVTIFAENMGTPSSTTSVNAYTGWQNGAPIAFSSTVNTDVRTSNASSGYTGASGGGNVFMGTSSGNFKDYIIAGINSNGYSSLTLSFGLRRDANPANSLNVSVSTDGITYTALSFTDVPSINTWALVTATGAIPSTATLWIKFDKNSTAQYRIDDIKLTGIISGPMVNFTAATSSASEGAGTAAVNLSISPATVAAGTITITIGGGSTATYGAGNDYTTTPAGPTTITISVPSGATAASFTINLIDDAVDEGADETIDFSITGTTGGISIGAASTHQFTIVENDYVPKVSFGTTSISALEGGGAQTFNINFSMPHPSGFTLTITVTNGPGAVYGAGNDYTTNPVGGSGTFIIGPFSGSATGGSFTVTPLTDALTESTEQVTFTITAASDPSIVIGPNASATLFIGDINSPPALFNPGDLAIVGVNANNNACESPPGSAGDDYVSFFCFKEITYGTEIIITDNGYERCNPGQWGNREGTVRMKRTGTAIPAGQVITFRIQNQTGPTNVTSVAPDAAWTCTNIGIGGTQMALNNGGDQLFFMQGGTWNPGTALANNATYTGTILFAFSTNPSPPWTAACDAPEGNQQSNLPPGVECFSMAPTLASDFNKYAGSITAASQRDWIIRIENAANWNSYASCPLYSSSGYIWLTAPILPIIAGTMTHGLWRGAINTDWFECKNWDDARIPDITTPVEINATAIRHCYVGISPGLNPGGTATCASLWQHFSGSDVIKTLSVWDNSALQVAGLFKVENTTSNGLTDQVMANATLSVGSVELNGSGPGATNTMLQATAGGGQINASGNLTIGFGSRLGLQAGPPNAGTLNLGGNFINQEDELHFLDVYSTVVLNGTVDQYIQNANSGEYFYDLRINKPSGDVYLTAPILVRHELDLTQGRMFSSTAALPTLMNGASAVGTSDASFVHGPIQRIGNTDFTFPVGKGNSYRPVAVSGITGGVGGAFTGEYFNASAQDNIGWDHQWPQINHVSDCEYWRIDRSAGSPNARVTLSWDDPESCIVDNLPTLRTAYWSESTLPPQWIDRGAFNVTGNNTAGTLSTTLVESLFAQSANYWTLASESTNNPLPVELLSFTATAGGGVVDLQWSTASELNNDHFTVERSADASAYRVINQVAGAGNSQSIIHYADVDRTPLSGWSYYRLRQTDLDGTSTLSQVVPVFFSGKTGTTPTVLYQDDELYVLHNFPVGSSLEVIDPAGRVVGTSTLTTGGLAPLPLGHLSRGVYLIRLTDGNRTASTRLVY